MIITREELDVKVRDAAGKVAEGDNMQKALALAASHAKKEDKVNDTMRIYRLSEKILGANGSLELNEADLDDLKERSHLKYILAPWVFGPLYTLLSRTEED